MSLRRVRDGLAMLGVIAFGIGCPSSVPEAGRSLDVPSDWDLRADLEPVLPSFSAGPEVALRLVIANESPSCRWALIDTVVAPSEGPRRPCTVVGLTVWDSSGVEVKPTAIGGSTYKGAEPHELLLLPCGRSYGIVLRIGTGKEEWRYSFPVGRYKARAKVVLGVRSFFESHPENLERTRQAWKRSSKELLDWMPDVVLLSNVVEFEVLDSKDAEH